MGLWSNIVGVLGRTFVVGGPSANGQSVTLGQAPGTPAYNPAWYALAAIYIDPVAGNDLNTGATLGSPIKTVAEMVRRYGSPRPTLTQNLTIYQLSGQTLGVDVFTFDPTCSGPINVVWDALTYAATVGAPFHPGSVTAIVQTAVGNDYVLNGGLPGGAAAGQIVHNITKGSYAFIDSIAGGDATVTQPILFTPPPQAFGTFTLDTTWAAGDSYQLLQPSGVNWTAWGPVGGQLNGLNPPIAGIVWIQGAHVYDQSGLPGVSQMTIRTVGAQGVLWLCSFDPFVCLDGTGDPSGTLAASCWFNGGVETTQHAIVVGGASNTAGNAQTTIIGGNFSGNFIMHGLVGVYPGWENTMIAVHLAGGPFVIEQGATVTVEPFTLGSIVWGATTINLLQATAFCISTSTFANQLKVTTLQLDGVGTGSSFLASAAANPFTAGIALTSANIDTGGGAGNPGLQNPRTGARFASA